jgi:nitrite reductase (NADH) small subunit
MSLFNLGPVERIPPGQGRTYTLGEHHVAVFHTRRGEVYATQAACPHRKGSLADGMLGGTTVACPLHGYKFDVRCGAAVGNDCGELRVYPLAIERGEILITVPDLDTDR